MSSGGDLLRLICPELGVAHKERIRTSSRRIHASSPLANVMGTGLRVVFLWSYEHDMLKTSPRGL